MPYANTAAVFALWLTVCPLCSQFETKLEPATISAYEDYLKTVEQSLDARWKGRATFLSQSTADNSKRLLKGELVIHPSSSPNPKDVPDGLIHDWVGAIYLPNTSIEKALSVLQDFDRHSKIYPEILRSRLIARQGNDLTGYWRVERKQQFVPAMFDVKQEAHYAEVAPGKWLCRARTTEIREVQDAGSAKEKMFPVGEGLGLLWRFDAFWSIQTSGSGVIAECRTVSLSRAIPSGMGWMIKPFIQNVPRESLASTLENTRKTLR